MTVERTTINLESSSKFDASDEPFGVVIGANQNEAYFLDYLVVLLREKKAVLVITLGVTALASIISLALPNIYEAKAIIMPPQESHSEALSMLGQIAPLAALAGKDIAIKSPTELYLAMLKSRTISDALIQRFDLKRVYRDKWTGDARKDLETNTDLSPGKEGTIAIAVDDKDPRRAAALANGYVDELRRLCQTMALTSAAQRRIFFEQQVRIAQTSLEKAEDDLTKTEERTGLIQLDSQARAIIESVANVRAQIAAKEVQLQTMRSFATKDNPELVRNERALGALRGQLAKLEQSQNMGNGDINVPTGNVPTVGMEYIRKYRDVKYYESLYELVAKQYEAARLDEANDAPLIQTLDEAIVPEKKSRPLRSLIMALALVTGVFLGIVYVLLKEFFITLNRQNKSTLQQLRCFLHW